MRVSVIVPLFNKGPYVGRCLDSIAAQTYSDFEIIVVDDGSTDEGPSVVASRTSPRLRLIRQKNAGPGAARNRGAAEARGELLAFLDADDAWHPEYLESSVVALDRCGQQVASVTSGYVEMPHGRSALEICGPRGIREGVHRITPATAPISLVHMLAYMMPCSTVLPASHLRRFGGFYEGWSYAEDATLWLRILLNEPVYFQLHPLVYVHRDASALSANLPGARPVEAFLRDPEAVTRYTPPELQNLLRRFYAIRAGKTAAVLGYWGCTEQARQVFRRFVSPRDWNLPFVAAGAIGCTPVATILGKLWRAAVAR
ncbi:MAG: glycosyltransferase family 2 protein [Bryobacteraceae bacterium]